ncbi:uncharacterized protein LOC141525153 isoform X2 [Cotesia typhae]|uniref:uncharacterized protein LOC141525153 isoform X2 n=1 Tax=Cotesia typhae TaxID=2053667 RepID=UPI003D685778
MPEISTGKYVQLSKRVFVPNEWPVKGLESFFLKLAKLVIDDVTSDRVIVLQVQNIPTILVCHGEGEETKYFFQRITNPGQTGAYVIDVVISTMDNLSETNSMVSDDSSKTSENYISDTDEGISVDNYNIVMHQSENRTAYYFVLIQENVQTLNIDTEINYTHQTQDHSVRWAQRNASQIAILIVDLSCNEKFWKRWRRKDKR